MVNWGRVIVEVLKMHRLHIGRIGVAQHEHNTAGAYADQEVDGAGPAGAPNVVRHALVLAVFRGSP